ncbi:hypothetical protein D3C76_329900 [compost metagenome]
MQVGVHFAACRTRSVQRDFDRFTAVLELHLADEQQKFGQFIGAGREGLNLFQRLRLVLEQVGVMLAQHAGAGTRRHHYRIIPGKQRQLRARHRPRLLGVTRGVGRLAAATLPLRILDPDPFALQQVDRVHPGFGVEQVDHTRAEQVDPRRFLAGVLPRFGQWRCHARRVWHSVVKKLAHQACLRVGPVIRLWRLLNIKSVAFSSLTDRVVNC